eukprot:2113398-Prymnesium_polylepis.1
MTSRLISSSLSSKPAMPSRPNLRSASIEWIAAEARVESGRASARGAGAHTTSTRAMRRWIWPCGGGSGRAAVARAVRRWLGPCGGGSSRVAVARAVRRWLGPCGGGLGRAAVARAVRRWLGPCGGARRTRELEPGVADAACLGGDRILDDLRARVMIR